MCGEEVRKYAAYVLRATPISCKTQAKVVFRARSPTQNHLSAEPHYCPTSTTMADANTRRIVLIGKSGSGKSSLANTIFGAPVFKVNHSSDSKSKYSEAQTRHVNGQNLTLIDTPSIFNTDRSAEDVLCEIFSCYTQCSPGPHAFLLVLLVEKFTEQEQAIVDEVVLHFSDEFFKYATVIFTHGDQLPEEMKIDEFVGQSKGLSDLVQKCGNRCHVIDNKYWKNGTQNEYRSNAFQKREILNSIERTFSSNNSSYFRNELLKQVEVDIRKEQDRILNSEGLSLEECREKAKQNVLQKYINSRRYKRYFKYVLFFVGLSGISSLLITKAVSFFRGNPVSESTPGVNEALPASMVEVAKDVVAPINSTLSYIIEMIGAILRRGAPDISNKTHTM